MKVLPLLLLCIILVGCGGGGRNTGPVEPVPVLPTNPFVGRWLGLWTGATTYALVDITVSANGVVSGLVHETAPIGDWLCGGMISGDGQLVIGNPERSLSGVVTIWRDPTLQRPPTHLQGDLDYIRPIKEGGDDTGATDMLLR
jgi:hypothetical protein